MPSYSRGGLQAKIDAYAARSPRHWDAVAANPRAVLREVTGLDIPASVELRVVPDGKNSLTLVLPYYPPEGEELSDDDLDSIAGGILDTTIQTCIVVSGIPASFVTI